MERRAGVSYKKTFWAKYHGQKLHFGRKWNKESVEVSAKHIPKKMHSGQNTMAKNYSWGKMQWRKRRGFGKIRTKKMHSGQNTMEKNCIWGKIQWRKG